MIDRRAFSLLLLGNAALLAGCAGGGAAPGQAQEEPVEMLFISPMGEPFRATYPAPYPVVAWFKGADANGDGKLDRAEFLADAERFFHVLDITKDGVIDHREIYYYEHKLVPEVLSPAYGRLMRRDAAPKVWRAQFSGGGGGPGGLGGAPVTTGPSAPDVPSSPAQINKTLVGAAPYGLLADPEPVQGADIRLTGLISLADFKTRAEQRFALLDAQDRGYLTLASLPETEAETLAPKKAQRGGGKRGA